MIGVEIHKDVCNVFSKRIRGEIAKDYMHSSGLVRALDGLSLALLEHNREIVSLCTRPDLFFPKQALTLLGR